MAIQEITIHGYRSLKDVTWRPGQLNLLVGPNASGKSNVLRAIELISIAARGDLLQSVAESGGIVRLLWDHQAGSLGWTVRIGKLDLSHSDNSNEPTFSAHAMSIARIGTGSGYRIQSETFHTTLEPFTENGQNQPQLIYSRKPGDAKYFDIDRKQFVQIDEEHSETGTAGVGTFEFSESLLSQFSDFRNPLPSVTRQSLEGWRIFHNLHVEDGAPIRQPATTQYAKKINFDGSNLVTVLHTLYTGNREFEQQIDDGMRAAFGSEYESLKIQPAAAQQVQLAVKWKSSSEPHAGSDLSDGTLRFLFLLSLLCNPHLPEVVAIDEPEAGLHPSMLPIIAEYAAAASERTQIILTSHSPEFLDAFSEFSPSVTLCHWEEGETSLHPLDSDELAVWLERYRLGELFSRGDLESLAMPPVETSDELEARLDNLPEQDEALASPGN